MPKIHAWRVGREWSRWHVGDPPLCGMVVPELASRCELTDHSAVLSLDALCKKCLMAYALETA